LAKRSISAAFASQMELAETDHEANHPRSDGTGAAETEEPAQVTSKHGKAVQMAALAADLVMVMGMAAGAKADLPSSPDGPRELARRLGALLDRIGLSKRLSGFRRGALPAGAMETDQKAAAKIREALKGLFRADILPETLGADQAINLAMAAQRVRLSPKDSGCVQVLSPAMAAAESFDHVIVIGLESGCYESSLPDQALCPPIERKRVRNQLASQLKSTCRQARRNAWLVWSEADKEQKQVKGCFLDEIEATFGTRRLPELVPDEVVLHRKPVDSFRVENARAWSERLDRLSRHLATSASLSGRPSWLPRVMELAWPSSRHFSPTRLQNHHKCRYMFFSTETVGCRGFDSDDTDRFEGHYIHRIMELAVQQARAFPPPRDSITRAAELAWPEYRDVLVPELEGLGTRLADMLDKCKELSGVTWHAASGSTEEPLAFEMTDADGAGYMVRLRIDVLLRGSISSDSRSIVLDYKRSMPKQADRQVADGTLLEPLVYIEAVRHCKGIAQDKLDMALLQLKPKENAKLQWVRMDDAWVAITPGISVPPVGGLLGIVSRSVSEVRKGIYGLTVLDSGEHPSKPCSYFCPARHACRHLRQPVRLREDW
ncbi:MAG: PD-(D/E)XK nuclease family protein, partial [Planctomycetota bacterium]